MNETEKMIQLIQSKSHDELMDVVRGLDKFVIEEINKLDIDEPTKIKLYNMCKERTNVEKMLVDAFMAN